MDDPGLILLTSLVLAGSAFLITLISTNGGMILLIFSMLLSPEIKLAELPERVVVVRFDDLLLGVIFFTWLAKLAINKELGLLRSSPLNLPILAYTVSAIWSTGLGIFVGDVESPIKASFYLLKYVEYYMLYFMVTNVINTRSQIKRFINAMLITSAVVIGYGLYQIISAGAGIRVTAPFEGPKGEPNTLSGYLLIILGLIAGQLLYNPSTLHRLLLGGLALLALPVFLYTLSRSGYISLLVGCGAWLAMNRRGRMGLVILLLLAVVLGGTMLPTAVIERVRSTFIPGSAYEVLGRRFALEESAQARLYAWRWILREWKERMVFGRGVSSLRIVDNQYALVLGELGVVGAMAFVWLLASIWRSSRRVLGQVQSDGYYYGLTLGFLVSFVALLVHALGSSTFIIVRIVEPFWFYAALIMSLTTVEKGGS